MKKLARLSIVGGLAAIVLLAAAPMQAPAPAAKPAAPSASDSTSAYDIDKVHSRALFRIHHAGAGMFWGRFDDVTGTFNCDNGKPDGASFDVSIKVDSVNTGSEGLDKHLKTAEFFNAGSNPTITFKSTSVKKGAGDKMLDVTGDLTLNGVTKSITVPVEFTGTATMRGQTRSGYEAVINVKRSDWKMTYGIPGVADEVRLIVALEGTAKK